MPVLRPSFRQEYAAFWSDRPRVTRYLLWFSPSLISLLVKAILYRKDERTLAETCWLLALDAGLALGGAALVVANDRLKRSGRKPDGLPE